MSLLLCNFWDLVVTSTENNWNTFSGGFIFRSDFMLKMSISTSVWSPQHPNPGRNIQQSSNAKFGNNVDLRKQDFLSPEKICDRSRKCKQWRHILNVFKISMLLNKSIFWWFWFNVTSKAPPGNLFWIFWIEVNSLDCGSDLIFLTFPYNWSPYLSLDVKRPSTKYWCFLHPPILHSS